MKYTDLDEDDKDVLSSRLSKDQAFFDKLKVDYRCENNKSLCFSCKGLELARTEFKIFHARCEYFYIPLVLNPDEPIIECSFYENRKIMSLPEMKEIATLIDNKDRKMGF